MTIRRIIGLEVDPVSVESRKSVAISLDDLVFNGRLYLYPEIEENKYFTVQFHGREARLTAGSYIGLIPINPRVTIEVRPKLPVNNLARVIDIAQQQIEALSTVQRYYASQHEKSQSILEFLARDLLEGVKDIETYGMYKEYTPHMRNTSSPHGRIDIRRTNLLNSSRGISYKVYSSSFEQTIDIPYNQLIKFALWFIVQRLPQMHHHNRGLRHELNAALLRFENVTLRPMNGLVEQVSTNLKNKDLPFSRKYYEHALKVALTIVAGKGVALVGKGEEFELSSYIINFDDVFEGYIRQVLRQRLPILDPELRVRNGNREGKQGLFREKKEPKATPDIVIDKSQKTKLIVDVKYKEKIDRSDINQVVTYGCSYEANTVVLIYPAKNYLLLAKRFLGTVGTIRVYTQAVDLSIENLQEVETSLAEDILELANS